jgi:hypothetical protein
MAQIIKHRRGTLANLSGVTLNNGELGIVTSSVANVGDAPLKTAIVVGHTDGTNRLPVSRLSYGNAVPNLGGITGGANFNDLIHYDSDNFKLYRLNTGGNTDLDLTGAIADNTVNGTLSVTGVVSASSNVWIGGNLHAVGNITFEAGSSGTITLGDSAGDSVSFAADVTSNIIPNASDSYNLGSDSQRWNELYLSGSISASGGPHHIISATTIDVDAEGALTLDGGSVTIGGDADVAFDIDTSTLDIDSSGAITIDGTSTVSIDGADDMNFTITSGTAGEDLTIAQLGGNDSSIFITAAGTGTDAISIDTTAGSMVIASSLTNGKTLTIGPSSAVQMVFSPHGTASSEKWSLTNTAGTATDAIAVTATAGGIDIGAGGVLALDGATGIDIGKAADVAITVESAAFDLDASGAVTIDSSASTIAIGGNAIGQKISVGGDTGTRTEVELNAILVDINGGGSGVTIDGGAASNFTTSAGALTLEGKTGIDIKENGTAVIAIDTNRDVLFSHTGGATGDPDVEFDGYVRFDGITEVADTTTSTTSATGALLVDGGIGVAENVNIGGNLTVTGNYTVNGTTTFISSSQLDIGDNIISVNSVGPLRYGGMHVHDVNAGQTGSLVWDSSNDYWVAGLSGSEYRVPIQAAVSDLTENKPVIVDGNGRLESSANITDDGTTVNMGVSTHVTGSVFASTGASVVSGSSVAFQVPSSTQLGYMSSDDTQAVTTGLIGYNTSTGLLTVSSVIDGGSF